MESESPSAVSCPECVEHGHDWHLVSTSNTASVVSALLPAKQKFYKCARCSASKMVVVRADDET